MGKQPFKVVIADISQWLRLQTTKVEGLSFRAWLSECDLLITSRGEVSTRDHMSYIKQTGFGAKEIWVIEGDHPVQALLTNQSDFRHLADLFLDHEVTIEFFETKENGPERLLVRRLAARLACDESELWSMVTSNHVDKAFLGAKIAQRTLTDFASERRIFLPYCLAEKNETAIREAIDQFLDLYQLVNLMIRVDGEASCDGQAFVPQTSIRQAVSLLEDFEATHVMIEPAVKHKSLSALLFIHLDKSIEFRGLTVQLQSRIQKQDGNNSYPWVGNWMYQGFERCVMSKESSVQAIEISNRLATLLADEGVTGPVSIDLLMLEEHIPTLGYKIGDVVATEANLRNTNGSYAWPAQQQLLRKHQEVSSGLVVFKPQRQDIVDFASLVTILGDLLYNNQSPYGVLPVVTTLLPVQAFLLIIGKDPEEFEQVLSETWSLLDCKGDVPRISCVSAPALV